MWLFAESGDCDTSRFGVALRSLDMEMPNLGCLSRHPRGDGGSRQMDM